MRIAGAPHTSRGGFTLLEMTVVIFIIGIIAAIVFPQLLPVIAFSQLEGSARHLSNYGSGAIAEATMLREDLTVRFDLDAQEYYTIRMEYPSEGEGEGGGQADQLGLLSQMQGGGKSPEDLAAMLSGGDVDPSLLSQMPADFDAEKAKQQYDDKFAKFSRRSIEARAKNVKQDQGLLDQIGPLFEKKFSLKEDEPIEVEMDDTVLRRTRLDSPVRIESVVVDGVRSDRGVVEIDVSPLGLNQVVAIYLANESGEYYTVVWDPVTGGTRIIQGKADIG
jgi:prepilin-type N-terminal cleavage/methylation domain-containing protein